MNEWRGATHNGLVHHRVLCSPTMHGNAAMGNNEARDALHCVVNANRRSRGYPRTASGRGYKRMQAAQQTVLRAMCIEVLSPVNSGGVMAIATVGGEGKE